MSDFDRALSILMRNQDKNFVQRVLNPYIFPQINNPDGTYSTHKMAWSTVDGKPVVYPTIIQNDSGALQELAPKDALDYAMKSGQYIRFNTPDEADWFSQNYKKVWE